MTGCTIDTIKRTYRIDGMFYRDDIAIIEIEKRSLRNYKADNQERAISDAEQDGLTHLISIQEIKLD